MAQRSTSANLYDPRQGGEAIRIASVRLETSPSEPPRSNYFSIYRIESGKGTFWADASQFSFGPDSLIFFVPYQHIRFAFDDVVQGDLIQFHANFLCVETFHAEVGCSGILFNDPCGVPLVSFDRVARREVTRLIACLRRESTERQLAFGEAMLAHLKMLLIYATRIKSSTANAVRPAAQDPQHPLLLEFRKQIEEHYRTLHSPADYARLLHVTSKTLGRIVRENLGTTPTELIRSRILTHAKWQLLHTLKSVKEISHELGFADELYFSRLFKKATGYSPTFFREFETEIRGGSNLSMFSGRSPILSSSKASDS